MVIAHLLPPRLIHPRSFIIYPTLHHTLVTTAPHHTPPHTLVPVYSCLRWIYHTTVCAAHCVAPHCHTTRLHHPTPAPRIPTLPPSWCYLLPHRTRSATLFISLPRSAFDYRLRICCVVVLLGLIRCCAICCSPLFPFLFGCSFVANISYSAPFTITLRCCVLLLPVDCPERSRGDFCVGDSPRCTFLNSGRIH